MRYCILFSLTLSTPIWKHTKVLMKFIKIVDAYLSIFEAYLLLWWIFLHKVAVFKIEAKLLMWLFIEED